MIKETKHCCALIKNQIFKFRTARRAQKKLQQVGTREAPVMIKNQIFKVSVKLPASLVRSKKQAGSGLEHQGDRAGIPADDKALCNAVSLVSVAKCLGPPAMQVHVRCNPPLNARAIAIRMQAPMKPAIK
jgi:hypothetical protein